MEEARGPEARLAPDDVDARRELWAALPLSAFPAERDSLAHAGHAPGAVIEALERLPPGRAFDSVYDVWLAIGGSTSAPSLEDRS
jgi:hypothetical protein